MYFDSVGIEYIPEEVLSKIKDNHKSLTLYLQCKKMTLLCEFYCIACVEYACQKNFVRLYQFIFY